MLLKPSISRTPETDPALDQAQLYARGLDHIRRFSRQTWTDHNTHDPGITILELLCYALTDLSYRAQFPIEDLLATSTDNAANMAAQFFTAREVLPNRPLTEADYRKLLIDLPEVRNAWVSRMPLTYYADTVNKRLRHDAPLGIPGLRPVEISGLFQVRLEFMDEVQPNDPQAAKDQQAVMDDAKRVLHANRNLCEEFVSIEGVMRQPYSLCAEIELTPDADANEVAAQLAFRVDQYLAPPVFNFTLAEMLAKPHADGSARTVDEIFDGPLLKHGFIDDDELAASDLRTEVRLSDVIRIIMGIDGVRAVRDILMNEVATDATGELKKPVEFKKSENKWRLKVPSGRQPRLLDAHQRLVFYKRQLPMPANAVKVEARLTELRQAVRSRLNTVRFEDLPIPVGRVRHADLYHSFQHHFPAVYGLSEAGLPSNADNRRRAQALQLKGYLLFFDQVMANDCAQLAHVGELFSRRPQATRTFFAQVVESVPVFQQLYPKAGITADDLVALLETSAEALKRRSRFLDHLLARCAENFHDYVSIMRSIFGLSEVDAIAAKEAFLKDSPKLSCERGLAFNRALVQPRRQWNSHNVSGLERRLTRLLGITNDSRRDLATVPLDEFAEVSEPQADKFRFQIKHPSNGKILLSSNEHYETQQAAHDDMELAISLGQLLVAFQCQTNDNGKHYFNIVNSHGQVIARSSEFFTTSGERDEAMLEVISLLRERYSGEGMYLIENILLRPEDQQSEPFLPICVDPACTDCADDDPYSYRVHFVLPAYAGRFQDLDFRRFVEETIRQETPAHILPKVCWVDAAQMKSLQQAYHDWLEPPDDATADQRQQRLATFIKSLFERKNVYPKRYLHDCCSDEKTPPFILDRTQLGRPKSGSSD